MVFKDVQIVFDEFEKIIDVTPLKEAK
ncbi:unnamed protein product, partial [Brachionus calyciflorus]